MIGSIVLSEKSNNLLTQLLECDLKLSVGSVIYTITDENGLFYNVTYNPILKKFSSFKKLSNDIHR